MSLIFLADDFPPEVGGIQTYVSELAQALSEHGEEVAVISGRQEGDREFDGRLPFMTVRVPTAGNQVTAAMNLADGARHAAGQLRTPPRCVIATKWAPEGPAAILTRGKLSCPLVLLGHGGEFSHAGGSLLKWLVQRVVLRRMSLCLANSQFTADLFRRAGVAPERVEVIGGGVRPERFEAAHEAASQIQDEFEIGNRRVLLTVARLVERKSHETVLAALPDVLERHPDVLYVIIGEGPTGERLQRQVCRRGLEQSVMMAGEVDRKLLPGFYATADIFVMPSRPVRGALPEGLGLVFFEAAAVGTPSIATEFGGIADAITDGETGLLVQPGDYQALAAAINRLLSNDMLRQRIGDAARERTLEAFTWEHVAGRFVDALSAVEHEETGDA